MFHCNDYFVVGGIRTCFEVFSDSMFLWISWNACPINLLLIRSHQAEVIIVKRYIQGRNDVTRVLVDLDHATKGRQNNKVFTLSATLPIHMHSLRNYRIPKHQLITASKWLLGTSVTFCNLLPVLLIEA